MNKKMCSHQSRLKGIPSGTFEYVQMCLDCGQFFAVWSSNGEQYERALEETRDLREMAARKLRFLADELVRIK